MQPEALQLWKARPELVAPVLQALLNDPDERLRGQALLWVGRQQQRPFYPLLLQRLGGSAAVPVPLPAVPAEEDLPAGERTSGHEAQYAAVAVGLAGLSEGQALRLRSCPTIPLARWRWLCWGKAPD